MRWGLEWCARLALCLAAAGIGFGGTLSAQPLPACAPLGAHLAAGSLPHTAYAVYTDAQNRWQPYATDGRTILMAWQRWGGMPEGGPVRFSVIHLPSTRMLPVPRGAYPSKTTLGMWRIEWPWIVGIAYTSRLPAFPANWYLWAGNAVTGKHFIIDSYRLHRHPVAEFFPHFALSDGRVAWELSIDRPARDNTFSAQQLAVIDLRTRKRTILTPPDTTGVLGRIAMSGSRIVWERTPVPTALGQHPKTDLMLADLQTGVVTQLSHNGPDGWSSLYPALHGQYLLFEQGPLGSDGGRPYLVDLSQRTESGQHRWWRNYRYRQLSGTGLTDTQMGDGLVWWEDQQLLDVTRSRVWRQPWPAHGGWSVLALAGRTAILQRQPDPNRGHMVYAAWVIPETCQAEGWLTAKP